MSKDEDYIVIECEHCNGDGYFDADNEDGYVDCEACGGVACISIKKEKK